VIPYIHLPVCNFGGSDLLCDFTSFIALRRVVDFSVCTHWWISSFFQGGVETKSLFNFSNKNFGLYFLGEQSYNQQITVIFNQHIFSTLLFNHIIVTLIFFFLTSPVMSCIWV